jgi:hypothetical protein
MVDRLSGCHMIPSKLDANSKPLGVLLITLTLIVASWILTPNPYP